MADADWKKRVGIPINYSSSDDEPVEIRSKAGSGLQHAGKGSTADEHTLQRFEESFGSTPPRTRMKNKSRDWERKKEETKARATRMRARADRRNTVDCAILNQLIIEPTIGDSKRNENNKKSLHLTREAERDSKLSMIGVTTSYRPSIGKRSSGPYEERSESLPVVKKSLAVPKLIESCSRFMSVKSRPIGCRISAPANAFLSTSLREPPTPAPAQSNRADFHESFSQLIKLGSVDKTLKHPISQEEQIWQTEVKDLIWLELQAWHADRSLEEEDKYLCTARQSVGDLIREIMTYKFDRTSVKRTPSASSTEDSGISISTGSVGCLGCISMYCKDCLAAQNLALKQVESLLSRLEKAESLYQSTKAMGAHYPLYKNEVFVARVKAMCLWYNMTRHHRLKLLILGKLLARLQGKQHSWPITEANTDFWDEHETESEGTTSSSHETDKFSSEGVPSDDVDAECAVDFPSNRVLCPIRSRPEIKTSDEKPTSPYRKYMENVLKSRGLGKSLTFLHRLHNVVLRKAHLTLEKPTTEIDHELENEFFDEEDVPVIEPPLEKDQIEELRRYGVWSKEAKELELPSYVPAFLFLSLIPLEVIHEFLKMRLETKVVQPNPLSLEQLMKELREGLSLAMIHRERYKKHITTALVDGNQDSEKHFTILDGFNQTTQKVFELYLTYVEQWVTRATPESHRKAALDEEWRFTKLISPMIPNQHAVAAKHFCLIIQKLLKDIGTELVTKIKELDDQAEKVEGTSPISVKWQLLTICRETQQMFTFEREKVLKLIAFAKAVCRDVEKAEFHREHNEELMPVDSLCKDVLAAVNGLREETFWFRNQLVSTIGLVQDRCDVKNLLELDEIDRVAVISRTREILHQGYKFGFEYHKDLYRLHEIRVVTGRDRELSLMTIGFAKMWMKFVRTSCEHGRGVRPRWAAHGFDFLLTICDPVNTSQLSEAEFTALKQEMDACISHVVGSPERVRRSPRSRRNSPLPRPRTPSTPQISTKPYLSQISIRTDSSSGYTSSVPGSPDGTLTPVIKITRCTETTIRELKHVRMRDAVNKLDISLDEKLRSKNLIGAVKELYNCGDKYTIRARSVNFSWHRGMKVGQGRFGKVYTAVNNSTGELMAMKEIPIQPGETRAIRRVAEELKIFEGINHKHLVKYYGVEIHREELLIFMELCPEGTLESFVELSGGLHEGLTRRYTAQILMAVRELHKNGIVHRDIKPANIFLTDDRNCLKLGDFGSAVKIEAHTTMPGELKGYVGTQAYMAPEVFTKTNTEGHGRAADIWSVGCCVIEMASGMRPWHQFDSSFQIMFKVGMGENPEIPDSLSQEGQEFVELCLKHDPKQRFSANELLQHNFCKVGLTEEDSKYVKNIETEVRRSFRKKTSA